MYIIVKLITIYSWYKFCILEGYSIVRFIDNVQRNTLSISYIHFFHIYFVHLNLFLTLRILSTDISALGLVLLLISWIAWRCLWNWKKIIFFLFYVRIKSSALNIALSWPFHRLGIKRNKFIIAGNYENKETFRYILVMRTHQCCSMILFVKRLKKYFKR